MFLMWGYEGEEIEDIEADGGACESVPTRCLLHYGVLSDQRNALLRARVSPPGEPGRVDANRQIATFASRGGIRGVSINMQTIF